MSAGVGAVPRTGGRAVLTALLAGALALLGAGCASPPPADRTAPPAGEAAPPQVEPSAQPSAEVVLDDEEEATTVRVASLKGPTTITLVGLMDDVAQGRATQDYQLQMYGTPDEVVPLLVRGEVDAALLPANLASVLHQRTATDDGPKIQVAALTTLGMLEVLEHGQEIRTLADLRGRTVYSTGKGASPEHVLNHLLRADGLEPGRDVVVEYRSEPTEVAALLASQPGAVGVLPQPFATAVAAQQPAVRSALRLAEEWRRVTPGSEMVTAVLVVRTEFARAYPQAVQTLLADVETSTAWALAEPGSAAPLVVGAGILPSPAVAEAALPACGLTFLQGAALRTALDGYLTVLHDADPASVGGSRPDGDLYLLP